MRICTGSVAKIVLKIKLKQIPFSNCSFYRRYKNYLDCVKNCVERTTSASSLIQKAKFFLPDYHGMMFFTLGASSPLQLLSMEELGPTSVNIVHNNCPTILIY